MILDKDIQEVLFSNKQIKNKCAELGKEISKYYEGKNPLFVGVLKGCTPFFNELLLNLDLYCSLDFMVCSSYNGTTSSTGIVNIVKDIEKDISGKDIVLVEDIVDSGLTMKIVKENLLSRGANSVRLVALLDKPSGRRYEVDVDWKGFEVGNQFVVGFGLDYDEFYRNLPYIGILKPEVYKK